MNMTRFAALLFGLAIGICAMSSQAQSSAYPARPVTLIVPYPAGSTDTFARMLAARLTKQWGQPIVVENKPGASGVIGMNAGRNAAPDGYTLLLGMSGPLVANPHLMAKIPYDSLNDYTLLAGLISVPLILVAHPSAPYSTIQELIEAARKHPGSIEFATPGNGTGSHIAAELFIARSGISLMHIPYKGSAPALNDLLGGHVKLMMGAVSEVGSHVKAGRLKALAVTGRSRAPQLPGIPALSELYPGFEAVGWGGLLGPRGLPGDIASGISADLRKVLLDPGFTASLIDAGLTPDYRDAVEFRKYVQSEMERTGKVIKAANVKLD